MSKAILLVGVPCSGKSTAQHQVRAHYFVVDKDTFIGREDEYPAAVARAAAVSSRPVVANSPFGYSDLVVALEAHGLDVELIFIIEPDDVLARRYEEREGRAIPPRHLSLQKTYAKRAREHGAFFGTSAEVIEHLLAGALGSAKLTGVG